MKYGNIDKKKLQGAIINTMFRDGINVYRVEDLNETIYFIERIIYKILTDKGKCISNLLPNLCNINSDISINTNNDINNNLDNTVNNVDNDSINYLETKKLAKKNQLTPKLFNRVILLQIPGISVGIAEVISKQYNSISAIYEKYKEIEKEELSDNEINKKKELLFADLLIETSTGKKRKIGKVLSKRILEFFTPI